MTSNEQTRERCCGAGCDQIERDMELKLIGVKEFLLIHAKKVALSDEDVYHLNDACTDYKLWLHEHK